MANIYEKNKPYPENRPAGSPENKPIGPKRSKYSIWTIVAILVVLALVIWLFAFTFGEEEAAAMEQMITTGFFSEAVALPIGT